jgi:hypothetical protein
MNLLERQSSAAAIPGPRLSPLERPPEQAVRARKPRHEAGKDGTAEGPTDARVAQRKPEDPVSAVPDPGPPSGWPDLIAFMAVLATGTLLVLFGHVASGGLTTACLALGGLFAAWWRFRKPRRR